MIDTRMISLDLLEQNTGQIEGLPANPREWKKKDVDALAKSLRETPELFEARPIIAVPHDGKYVILGGNLRYEGCRKNGDREAPVCVLPGDTPVAKMKEIVIKDNGSFGEWDYDRLADEWDDLPLPEWGVDTSFGKLPAVADDPIPGVEDDKQAEPDSLVMVFTVSLFGKSGDAVVCEPLSPEMAEKLLSVLSRIGGGEFVNGFEKFTSSYGV